MIIDANANVGPSVYDDFEFSPTFERLAENLAAAAIDGAVVAPLKPPSFDFDRANARLAARLQKRATCYGIGRVDPRVDDSVEHAERALSEYNLHGFKLHPWEETFSITSPNVAPLLEVAASHTAPVWIHAGYPGVSHALSVREIAQQFPDVPMILTHGAQLDISGLSLTDAFELAETTTNTYFELSGVYRRDFIEDLVETIGPERVLFGTNAPYFHPTVEKSRVTNAELSDTTKQRILGENILNLLEISDSGRSFE